MKIRISVCCLLAILLCVSSGCGASNEKDPLQAAMCSVVTVHTTFSEDGDVYATSSGSALIYSLEEGGGAYLLTNYHVLYDDFKECVANDISIAPYGFDPAAGVAAEMVACALEYDLALLYCKQLTEVFPAATPIGRDETPLLGDEVVAIGNALGRALSITAGVVSVERESVKVYASYYNGILTLPLIRVDCALNQGNSGGGLFSTDGAFLGMVDARQVADDESGIGYVLPAVVVRAVGDKLKQAVDSGQSPRFFDFGAQLSWRAQKTVWDEEKGALTCQYDVTITSVLGGSIAAAFFEEGDVLRSFCINEGEREVITCAWQVEDLLLMINEGDRVEFVYQRNGAEQTAAFTVSASHMKAFTSMIH